MASVLAKAETWGINIRPVLRGAGVPWEMLDDPEARITQVQVLKLWRELERESGRSSIGLDLLECDLSPEAFGVVMYRAMTAATLGGALEAGVQYHPALKPEAVVRLERYPDRVMVVHEMEPDAPRSNEDFAIGCYAVLARRWTKSEERPVEVGVTHKATEDRARYEAIMGCPIVFGQRHATVTFSKEQMGVPLSHAHDALVAHFDEMASAALAETEKEPSFEDELRGALRRAVSDGDVRLTPVAETLGCSPRTLQRRLKEHNLRFQVVADEVRCAEAMRLLRNTDMPVSSVAEQLGYADDKSFRRAFRRWTKSSPGQVREQARNGG
jgi:AraC-like DNA-binding protein